MKRLKLCVLIITIIFVIMYVRNVFKIINERDKDVNVKVDVSKEKQEIKKVLTSNKDKIIIIDAGHGGKDPGKVGVNNQLEKDINLDIAFKLRDKLVSSGFSVIMTRTKDVGLYSEFDRNKKNADLRNRVNIINESDAIVAISIHQNAYSSNKEKGAQVFYYTASAEGKQLADIIQNRMVQGLDPQNHRIAKANDSYYLLKKTTKPTVIVECGFLSNPEEAELLCDAVYQERVAWQVHMGVLQYLRSNVSGS